MESGAQLSIMDIRRRHLPRVVGAAVVWAVFAALVPLAAAETVSLAGTWRFALDRSDEGLQQQWFDRKLADAIELPGILQAQDYGDEISVDTPWAMSLYDRHWYLRDEYRDYIKPGEVKVPFLCQPPRHYLGVAWYQRDFLVPDDWGDKRVVLTLERPHWSTTTWVDGRKVGSSHSLCVPHVYDLGMLSPGTHQLTVRIDNRMLMPYRPDAHSVSDSLGGSWNGIAGRIDLAATDPVWIADAQGYPDVKTRSVLIRVRVGNRTGRPGSGTLSARDSTTPIQWDAAGGSAELRVALGKDAPLWDEFHPALHRLVVRLRGNAGDGSVVADERELMFGLRELSTSGNEFVLNGRPIQFRGTHFGGDFPLTGYPPTDVDSWKRIIRTCQAWGLNHMRFHSWCPPEAAFTAADELGFYLQPECGMWNEFRIDTPMEEMLYAETERMMRAYGNHPSFMLLSPSNEPKGRWKECLVRWVNHCRAVDPRRLYTTGTGWSLIDEPGPVEGADYLAVHRIGLNMLRGTSAWFGRDYRQSLRGVDVPVIAHELGQWCAYPDFGVISKFTGYLRPKNYEIFRESSAAHGTLERNQQLARASGRFQLACYKEEIEANLRTPGLGGFQLLDLHDYIGQGTALVGLLDPFWKSKGYATPEEFRRFCGPTVLLARLPRRVFTPGESLNVPVEVSHYGAESIVGAVPAWRILDSSGHVVVDGELPQRDIAIGKGTALGTIDVALSQLAAPAAYRLEVYLRDSDIANDWTFWLYPEADDTTPAADILATRSWAEAERHLAEGRKVLFVPRHADLDWTCPPLDRVPIFWNRQMNPGWGRMLGLWCDAGHPALGEFPTESYCDWQWTDITRDTRAINLDRLPPGLQPIVQPIDDWNRNYKLGLVFECRVNDGRLMVCSADVVNSLDKRPVARQLRRSLLDYMAGEEFQPAVEVPASAIRALLFDTRIMRKLGAQAAGGKDTRLAIDGDPNTYWLSGPHDRLGPDHHHELTIRFEQPVTISGLVLMPRQNHREHEGDIRDYVVQASNDGLHWQELKRGELVSTFEPQEVRFGEQVTVSRLKLIANSGFGGDRWASLAELAVIHKGLAPDRPDVRETQYQRVPSATPDIEEGVDTVESMKVSP